jgi:hypothetical protein
MANAVLKVGGNFQRDSLALRRICKTLGRVGRKHRLLIVPGGGNLVDFLRELQKKRAFSNRIAHFMAIRAMEIYGLVLHKLISNSILTHSLDIGRRGKPAILLPYRVLQRTKELEASWRVTSDSIAAWVSSKIGCPNLILVKAVDGVFQGGEFRKSLTPSELEGLEQYVVDPYLPRILRKARVTCWIVNGKYPRRIERVLESKKTTCTVVLPGN